VVKKVNQLILLLNERLGLFLGISLGVFMFILFFQPFPLDRFDFNNKLIFISGMAGIVFFILLLLRVFTACFILYVNPNNMAPLILNYINNFLILALSSVAFTFYLRYVGLVEITFYVVLKIAIICLIPTLTSWIDFRIKELKQDNKSLHIEKRILQKQIEKYEEDFLNKSIDFFSENNSAVLSIQVINVAFIKSADNYVEIVYKDDDSFKKKLIRNTLKNVELQIKPYSNFIRCHRICIVNLHHIEKLNSNYGRHFLTLKGYQEFIPVSRQYLLKLKEAF